MNQRVPVDSTRFWGSASKVLLRPTKEKGMSDAIRLTLLTLMVVCAAINFILARRAQEKRLRAIRIVIAVACLGNATYWGWGLWG